MEETLESINRIATELDKLKASLVSEYNELLVQVFEEYSSTKEKIDSYIKNIESIKDSLEKNLFQMQYQSLDASVNDFMFIKTPYLQIRKDSFILLDSPHKIFTESPSQICDHPTFYFFKAKCGNIHCKQCICSLNLQIPSLCDCKIAFCARDLDFLSNAYHIIRE
jgi:hypothetical protein